VGLFAEGVNGRLPNVDLITAVVKSYTNENINVNLHGNINSASNDRQSKYMLAAENLLQFVKHQAIGFPNAAHGLFTRYVRY
jgi:Gaa1-like, GPI transamidase component